MRGVVPRAQHCPAKVSWLSRDSRGADAHRSVLLQSERERPSELRVSIFALFATLFAGMSQNLALALTFLGHGHGQSRLTGRERDQSHGDDGDPFGDAADRLGKIRCTSLSERELCEKITLDKKWNFLYWHGGKVLRTLERMTEVCREGKKLNARPLDLFRVFFKSSWLKIGSFQCLSSSLSCLRPQWRLETFTSSRRLGSRLCWKGPQSIPEKIWVSTKNSSGSIEWPSSVDWPFLSPASPIWRSGER